MHPIIKHFQWTDLGDRKVSFPTLLEIYVASSDGDGMTRYEIAVTTLEEFSERLEVQKQIAGHGQLVVASFNPHDVETFLKKKIEESSADTWEELDFVIRRFGRSEFEMTDDYWSPPPWP